MRYALIAAISTLLVVFGILQLKNSSGSQLRTNDKITWESMQDAGIKAQNENKKILVYVYTDWCSWCRKMEGEVFTDAGVAEMLNSTFIPVALNAESGSKVMFNGMNTSEKELAQMFGVRGFPTTLFLTASGDPITVAPGFIPADRFVNVMKFIGEDHYKSMQWEEFLLKHGG
jgi:thioredoxin-related protein